MVDQPAPGCSGVNRAPFAERAAMIGDSGGPIRLRMAQDDEGVTHDPMVTDLVRPVDHPALSAQVE